MSTIDQQTERAFQKQPTVFLNSKARVLGIGKKKKELRYVRNVGLGFKTPKEVRNTSRFNPHLICRRSA